ncbi:response regulator transcription factor [Vineibacter terrae]|uniref:Response regulator transcription factor n=1 Tax=Vineibacter terrae TaxID=2586908 RepID=A0A5C8PDI2_9HYPH|nr:response regulator transcription factor [Vineibacter terrae]TXL71379.1 response regulator transcription factor [Vineibacter terrae]
MTNDASRLLPRHQSGLPASGGEPECPLVLIVDDDEAVRTALQELLLSVGLDATCFASTRELLGARLPARPGCLILDIRMPGLSGLDFQQHLASSGNRKPIIFLSGHADVAMTVKAMKAGAVDFLTKPVPEQGLLDAVSAGIARDIAQRAEDRIVKLHVERFATLTPRERQVLHALAYGRINKQIAFDLGISEVTVKLHRGNVMRKMQAASVGQLVRTWESMPIELRDGPLDDCIHGRRSGICRPLEHNISWRNI